MKRRSSPSTREGVSTGAVQSATGGRAETAAMMTGDRVREARIAARAYTLFLARGCQHGDDWADWFQAEREVLAEEQPAPGLPGR